MKLMMIEWSILKYHFYYYSISEKVKSRKRVCRLGGLCDLIIKMIISIGFVFALNLDISFDY